MFIEELYRIAVIELGWVMVGDGLIEFVQAEK